MTPGTYVGQTPLPFAPVLTDVVELRWDPDRSLTYTATPMAKLWEAAHRSASIALVVGDDDRAREHARYGVALEDAYMKRLRGERDAERAREGVTG